MTQHPLSGVVEAVLLAAGRPVTVEQLLELFDEGQRPPPEEVASALAELQQSYAERGVELREVASGWRVQIRPQHADIVSRLWQERPSRYSRALLETLALIAYRQPITRGEIEDIRGVTVSTTIMRTLHERNWIRVVGHREVPGRPELLSTTREFLDYFGLKSLDDLPTLAELRDLEDIKEQLDLPAAIAAAGAALAEEPELLGARGEAMVDPEAVTDSIQGTDAATAANGDASASPTAAVVDTTDTDTTDTDTTDTDASDADIATEAPIDSDEKIR